MKVTEIIHTHNYQLPNNVILHIDAVYADGSICWVGYRSGNRVAEKQSCWDCIRALLPGKGNKLHRLKFTEQINL